ncbi:MAG: hypothetical protein R3F11_26300 [Verrucomicrobiales bacterium]
MPRKSAAEASPAEETPKRPKVNKPPVLIAKTQKIIREISTRLTAPSSPTGPDPAAQSAKTTCSPSTS